MHAAKALHSLAIETPEAATGICSGNPNDDTRTTSAGAPRNSDTDLSPFEPLSTCVYIVSTTYLYFGKVSTFKDSSAVRNRATSRQERPNNRRP